MNSNRCGGNFRWAGVAGMAAMLFGVLTANVGVAQPKKAAKTQLLPAKITARVSDRVTGKPLSGAVVRVEMRDATASYRQKVADRRLTLRSNDKGEVAISLTEAERVQSTLLVGMSVTHSGYARGGAGVLRKQMLSRQKSGGRIVKDVKFWPGKEITAVVTAPDGTPLPKLRVRANFRHERDSKVMPVGRDSAVTDKTGRFRLTAPFPGMGIVWINVKGYVPEMRIIGERWGDWGKIVLRKGMHLQGKVFDARGKPVLHASVNAHLKLGDSKVDAFVKLHRIGYPPTRYAYTDQAGAFQIDGLAEGKYTVTVSTGGYIKPARHIFLSKDIRLAGKTPAPLTLRAVPHVEIRVRWVDSKGKPTSGTESHISGTIDGRQYDANGARPNPKTGEAIFRAPHGLQRTYLSFDGTQYSALRTQARPGAPLTTNLAVELGTLNDDPPTIKVVKYVAPLLTVKVIDAAGNIVGDVKLTTRYKRSKNMRPVANTPTGEVWFRKQSDGRWQSLFDLQPDMELTIKVQKAGYKTASRKVTLKEAERREIVFTLKK